jgi:hypothetical protein
MNETSDSADVANEMHHVSSAAVVATKNPSGSNLSSTDASQSLPPLAMPACSATATASRNCGMTEPVTTNGVLPPNSSCVPVVAHPSSTLERNQGLLGTKKVALEEAHAAWAHLSKQELKAWSVVLAAENARRWELWQRKQMYVHLRDEVHGGLFRASKWLSGPPIPEENQDVAAAAENKCNASVKEEGGSVRKCCRHTCEHNARQDSSFCSDRCGVMGANQELFAAVNLALNGKRCRSLKKSSNCLPPKLPASSIGLHSNKIRRIANARESFASDNVDKRQSDPENVSSKFAHSNMPSPSIVQTTVCSEASYFADTSLSELRAQIDIYDDAVTERRKNVELLQKCLKDSISDSVNCRLVNPSAVVNHVREFCPPASPIVSPAIGAATHSSEIPSVGCSRSGESPPVTRKRKLENYALNSLGWSSLPKLKAVRRNNGDAANMASSVEDAAVGEGQRRSARKVVSLSSSVQQEEEPLENTCLVDYQQQEESIDDGKDDRVQCPVCGNLVLAMCLEDHVDSCTKYALETRRTSRKQKTHIASDTIISRGEISTDHIAVLNPTVSRNLVESEKMVSCESVIISYCFLVYHPFLLHRNLFYG